MTDWKAAEDAHLLAGYAKFPFVLARGEGSYVFDDAGRRYLDFYGGHAVALLGHCPPPVVDAVRRQAGELMFYSTLAYVPVRARALGEDEGELRVACQQVRVFGGFPVGHG